MRSKLNLMAVLVGLAMVATPLTAAAKDHNRYDNSHAARVASSTHYVAPAAVTRHEFSNGARATWMTGLAPNARRNWREERALANANAYRNYGYGNSGAPVYAAPAYVAPAYVAPVYSGYGGGYGGGNPCRRAQSVVTNYYKDRNTGHPAAAYDLVRQNQWAFRSGCATGAPVAGGLLGGLGGYGGAPAYSNYGGYNGGYNGAYGQPYGGTSMLAPLLQQFIR